MGVPLDKLKYASGTEKHSTYVRDYFDRSNLRAGIYMAVIVLILEAWMVTSLTKIVITSDKDFTPYWLFTHYGRYGVLIAAAVMMLIYVKRYFAGKGSHIGANIVMWIFCIACVWFGIYIGKSDYAKGNQILCFITMALFAHCLIVRRPIVSLLFSAIDFELFHYFAGLEQEFSKADSVNLLTVWITLSMICVSLYFQRLREARNDESLEKINEELLDLSLTDELTGIHNMRYFNEEAVKMLENTSIVNERDGANIELLFMYFDIENFKAYNEKYGFDKGDKLLKDVAAKVTKAFGNNPAARFSDDHFVALASKDDCVKARDEIEDYVAMVPGSVKLRLKTGAYPAASRHENISLACDRARIACSFTKKKYDIDYYEYDDTIERDVHLRQHIVNNIDVAVDNGYIKAFYQPVISTKTDKLCGLEALARWADPERGMLSPAAFIGTLEEYRQIHKVDQCMLETVAGDLSDESKNMPKVPVSINFSRLDFELYDVVKKLDTTLKEKGIPSNMIDVEITESALTDNGDKLKQIMSALKEKGFSLWLDDFGSGYSSLNVLKDYKFDVLKIDMIFLRGFETNPNSRVIIKTIVDLAKSLNMVTLAEGVETREQYEFLKEIGCDKAQGYYFSKPVDREALIELMKKGAF